jgi:ABC-type sugar transport system substrate-binding protein
MTISSPLTLAVLAATTLLHAPQVHAQDKKYTIGFSQLAFDDPWRVAFNNQMTRAAAKHPDAPASGWYERY